MEGAKLKLFSKQKSLGLVGEFLLRKKHALLSGQKISFWKFFDLKSIVFASIGDNGSFVENFRH